MYASLFKNKLSLLAFVVLVLASAQLFVGNWDDEFATDNSPGSPASQGNDAENMAKSGPPSELTSDQEAFYNDDTSFVSDEDLIDSAEGYDPTPAEDESYAEEDFESDPALDDSDAKRERPIRLRSSNSGDGEEPGTEEPAHN